MAADPAAIPDREQIKAILSAPDGPPRMTLDIGGSEDLNGDGLVIASLNDDGDLVLEDV